MRRTFLCQKGTVVINCLNLPLLKLLKDVIRKFRCICAEVGSFFLIANQKTAALHIRSMLDGNSLRMQTILKNLGVICREIVHISRNTHELQDFNYGIILCDDCDAFLENGQTVGGK